MAVRKDSIQLKLDIEGQEGVKTYQKLLDQSRQLNNEMRKLKRQGKENTDEFKKLEKQSASLNKQFKQFDVANAKWGQLQKRARDLSRALKYKLTPGTKEFIAATKEFQKVNARLDEIKTSVKGVKNGMDEVRIAGIKVPTGIVKAFIASQVIQYFMQLFNILDETTKQFVKLRGTIQQATGAIGTDLDEYTTQIAGISKTFGKDTDEILSAANSLTKQLTGDFSESLKLIEQGFLAGADRGGDFLNQLKEYPSFFREAGLTGEQFMSVISQSVQEGVFSDKGVDLIKEFNIRVREMPQATKDAFEAIGTNSEEISKSIDEKGIGGAFTLIQKKLRGLKEDSPAVGQALADIFGGPGEDAGIQFIKMLDLTEDAMDDLLNTSNDYTLALQEQLEADKELAEAQNRVAKGFKDTSNSLSVYISRIKAFLFNVAADVIEFFGQLPATIKGIKAVIKQDFKNLEVEIRTFVLNAKIAFKQLEKLNPFGKTSEQIDEEIKNLHIKRIELQAEAKSLGEAYREAYLEGMKDVEQRKKVSEALFPSEDELKQTAKKKAKAQVKAENEALRQERAKSPSVAALGTLAPTAVASTGEGAGSTTDQNEILKNRFLKALITEQEYEDQRYQIQQDAYDRRLEYIRQMHGEESQAFVKLENEKLQAQKDYEAQRTELTKQSEEFKTKVYSEGLNAMSDIVGSTIELLQGEEGERKKNSLALKAFSVGKVLIDTQEAIMAIVKNAQANPSNILFPGSGNLIAGLKIAAVTTKSALAVNKIRNQNFYDGGYTGSTPFIKDTKGRDIVGGVHAGEWVAPRWQVEHPVAGQVINWLDTMRQRGFQEGGFTGQTNIPVPQATTTTLSGTDNKELKMTMKLLLKSNMEMADAIKRKQFSVPVAQVADALDEEYRLRDKSSF